MKFVKFKKAISVFVSSALALQFSCVDKFCYATKNEVNVLYTTDDGYFGPTLVSMQSALDSKNTDTFYNFHIMVDGEFSNQQTLSKFETKNEARCKVSIYNMKNAFADDWTSSWPPSMYYRLKAASVLKNIDKCIYIDGDTLVNSDLKALYNIDLQGNYIGGVLDASESRLDVPSYINSGVALLDLDKIRTDNKEEELLSKVKENNSHNQYIYPDQDIWNVVFGDQIKRLPMEYNFMTNLFMWSTYGKANKTRTYDSINDKQMTGIQLKKQHAITYADWFCKEGFSHYSALAIDTIEDNYPVIVHFVCNKPWNADCGVVNKGKNREVFEPLYQKWYETAGKVKNEYGVSFPRKKSKTGKIVGLGALTVGLLTATGIIAKKTCDKKHNKKGSTNKPNLAKAS